MHSCRALIRKWGNKGEAGIPGIHFTGVAYSRRYGSGSLAKSFWFDRQCPGSGRSGSDLGSPVW